jgi:hypothetical protein
MGGGKLFLFMVYGYYFKMVRFAALIGFIVLAYNASENKQKEILIIFIALALLFQPFIKITLGREIRNIVDVMVAIGLLISLKKEIKKLKYSKLVEQIKL